MGGRSIRSCSCRLPCAQSSTSSTVLRGQETANSAGSDQPGKSQAPPLQGSGQDDNDENAALQFNSARSTLRAFITSIEAGDYRTAALALDFAKIEPEPDDYAKVTYAQRLKACIDRLALVK